jgi:mannitol-specific phosphotransferase system IIBC component
MVWLLWANVPALFVFAIVDGYPPVRALVDVAAVIVLGLLAIPASFPRRGREAAVTIGLLTCSAVLVHLWHGTIEAHFHYFVIVCVLALYEEWFPYLLALAYVVLQHGLMGTMDPGSVYGHAAGGLQSPWVWAAIHGGFIGAMAVASIVSWRLNEHVREQLRHNQLRLRFQADHDALTEPAEPRAVRAAAR